MLDKVYTQNIHFHVFVCGVSVAYGILHFVNRARVYVQLFVVVVIVVNVIVMVVVNIAIPVVVDVVVENIVK